MAAAAGHLDTFSFRSIPCLTERVGGCLTVYQWLDGATGDRLAAAIPGARRETVPEAGHFLAEDNPDGTAEALLRFFA